MSNRPHLHHGPEEVVPRRESHEADGTVGLCEGVLSEGASP